MSNPRDMQALKIARTRLGMAKEQLLIAMRSLREGGWTESADDIFSILRQSRCFTNSGGLLDILETAPDWPE